MRQADQLSKRSTVYFLTDGGIGVVGVRRTINRVGPGPAAFPRSAIAALLRGPTVAEEKAGLSTALRSDTVLLGIELRAEDGAEAVVNLRGLPSATYSSVGRARVITQVARTLIGLGNIERVRLLVDGQPWGLPRHDGGIVDRAYDYDALRGFNEICTAVAGEEAVPGDCFSALP